MQVLRAFVFLRHNREIKFRPAILFFMDSFLFLEHFLLVRVFLLIVSHQVPRGHETMQLTPPVRALAYI